VKVDPAARGARGVRRPRLQFLGAALLVLAFGLVVVSDLGTARQRLVFVDVVTFLVPLGAAAACAWRATLEPQPLRTGWALVGAGCASWALGQAAWAAYVLALGRDAPPSPGIADVGYLGMVPLAGAGLLAFLSGPGLRASRLRFLLDAAIVAASLLFVSWAAVIRDVVGLTATDGITAAGLVYLAYPTGDILLATLAFVLLSQARSGERRTLALLGAGAFALAVADTVYVIEGLRGLFKDATLVHTAWVGGFLLIALAALRPQRAAAVPTMRPTALAATLPLIPLLIALGAAMQSQREHGLLSPFLFWAMLALFGLVLARQHVLLLENIDLTRRTEEGLGRLRASEQSRVRLLHTVTHDLQNPLSPVLLQLAVLDRRAGLGAAERQSVDIIRRNVRQVERLVQDLGDVAKMEDGRLALQPAPIDLRETLADVHATFGPDAQERGLALVLDIDGAIPVLADAGRVRQVTVNLVSNALKFTPSGGTVRLAGRAAEGRALVEVSDSGRGLTAEETGRLFQPFAQVHDRKEVRERGTGLGLYVSKGIVERQGGGIGVHSEGLGRGSTFWFSLPLRDAAPAPASGPSGPR
jgi:signal transduction histidine kinase